MSLPPPVRDEVQARIGPIERAEPVGGGCVSSAHRIETAGESFFLKFETGAPADFFAAEAAGLERLSEAADQVRVPAVVAHGADPSGYGWIIMEWLEPGVPTADSDVILGASLARLHRTMGNSWGWDRDGYIGRLPQSNRPRPDWPTFWWEERIEPQLTRAHAGSFALTGWPELADRLPELLAPAADDGPSLLHGDLWSGNVLFTGGTPALIDPACYHGHREVDLAMAELFGGFSRDFYRAYLDEWPLAPGWQVRREIYQLYYLLVHVNLFGEGYVSRTESVLRSVLAA